MDREAVSRRLLGVRDLERRRTEPSAFSVWAGIWEEIKTSKLLAAGSIPVSRSRRLPIYCYATRKVELNLDYICAV